VSTGASAHSGPGPNQRQTGAALVTGLILLLILTVLGISGMNMATLELAMANNVQARALAFQAAETGIDIALSGPLDPAAPVRYLDRRLGNGSYGFDAIVVCTGTRPWPKMDADDGPELQAVHFEVAVTGKGPRNAVARLTQGFYLLTPVPEEAEGQPEQDSRADSDSCLGDMACDAPDCLAQDPARRPVRTFWREEPAD
jgi:hypothetical protein